VNDFAHVLTNIQKQSLENTLQELEKITGDEVAVVTVQNLEGDYIEHYAEQLFKEWGIGKRNKDNGVLLLIAFEERKVRIEVGYGLEGVITDSIASSIIRNEITPSFANGQYAEGIDKGVAGIIKTIRGIYETKEAPQQKNFLDDHPILIIIFIFIIIYVRFAYFGGLGGSISFGKGGFGGFGGGRSGGGGTTGRW
jgi:uncharacterized protein